MSDINQPCPTICSACKGKCSDQLVLPAGCVLRPTIERVEAVLTPERVNQISIASYRDESQEAWNIALARAISREVVAILAKDHKRLTQADIYEEFQRLQACDDERLVLDLSDFVAGISFAERHYGISTPAASGIGESGGG